MIDLCTTFPWDQQQRTSHRYFHETFPLSRIGRSSASTIGSQKSSGQSPDERHKGRERERERGDLDDGALGQPQQGRGGEAGAPRGGLFQEVSRSGLTRTRRDLYLLFFVFRLAPTTLTLHTRFVFFRRRISRTVCVRAKPEEGVEGVSAPGRLSPPIASRGLTPPPNPPRSSRSDHSFLRTAGPEEEGERSHGTRRRNRRRRQARPGGTLRRNLGGRLRQRHGTFFFFLLLTFVDDAHQALTRTQTLSLYISFSVSSAGRRRSLGC